MKIQESEITAGLDMSFGYRSIGAWVARVLESMNKEGYPAPNAGEKVDKAKMGISL